MTQGGEVLFSINECESLIVRAARGAGYPIGLGQDLAAAAIWLEWLGMPGVKLAAAALASDPPSTRNLPQLRPNRNGWSLTGTDPDRPISALHCLGAVMDLIRFEDEGPHETVTLVATAVDHAQLLLAAAGIAARPTNLLVEVRFSIPDGPDAIELLLCQKGSVTRNMLHSTALWKDKRPCDVSFSFRLPVALVVPDHNWSFREEVDNRTLYDGGIFIPPRALSRLRSRALKTLVPASEKSRQLGAGAGALDND